MKKFSTLVAVAALTAWMLVGVALAVGNLNSQPAYATILEKDQGASGFAPGKIIGPDTPKESAPGQIPPPPCPACDEAPGWDPNGGAKLFAPGQEGQEAGIIGPDLKK